MLAGLAEFEANLQLGFDQSREAYVLDEFPAEFMQESLMQFRLQIKSHPTAANSAWSFRGVVAAMAVFLCLSAIAAPISVDRAVLVKDGVARAAILVPARILDDPKVIPEPASVWRSLRPEDN